YTPPLGNSVLPGITRNSVMHIAHELGIPVVEQIIPREMLYICDELFFSGTAGPITKSVRKEFYGIVNGVAEDRFGWLTPVPIPVKQPVSV
ncbi:MAG: aminotransferase class IV, partial [Candidatus Korobacteraceae bacterium]